MFIRKDKENYFEFRVERHSVPLQLALVLAVPLMGHSDLVSCHYIVLN